MKIDRVNIKGTETRTRPDSHVVYLVEVQTKSEVWVVPRRFNEFVELNTAVTKSSHSDYNHNHNHLISF